jgi:arsenate reductase
MAEGILRSDAGDRFEVFSAGINPTQVRPEAVAAMREIGIDISRQVAKSAAEFSGQDFDYVITVCDNARETCPVFPGRTIRVHQAFEDPPPAFAVDPDSMLIIFRRVRDEIRDWMKGFVTDAAERRFNESRL